MSDNIKVCLRIKPILEASSREKDKVTVSLKREADRCKITFNPMKKKAEAKVFTFNEVFETSASQIQVYENFKDELLHSVVEGVKMDNLV